MNAPAASFYSIRSIVLLVPISSPHGRSVGYLIAYRDGAAIVILRLRELVNPLTMF
jgi:hypothetical protein